MYLRKESVIYAILWFLTILAFSIPWYSGNGETYTGWNFVIPFSATYLIGILLGLIVLITKRWAFGLTIAAGILMILGVVGAGIGGAIGELVGELTGAEASSEPGIGLAFLISLAYLVGGSILGKRMEHVSERVVNVPTKYCINCGAEIPPDSKFCKQCGSSQY
jgi:ribosomal protein L40E